MHKDPVVIITAARTPQGCFQGELKDVTATELGSIAIRAALERSHLAAENIEATIMGNVLPAGLGQAPARQAARGAGLPDSVNCTTINKMCGSGMKATMLAHDLLRVGTHDTMMVGGLESMTNAPYLLPGARQGYRLGHNQVMDHMFLDGLEDAYDKGKLMGVFAENTAKRFGFTREEQDAFAITSLKRAQEAIQKGFFIPEIAPVKIITKNAEIIIDKDEQPRKASIEKIPALKPAFSKDGTVTAANSSSISDGASALLLMRASTAEKHGLRPLAKIVAHSTHSHEPQWFTTAPVGAINKLYAKTGWSDKDVDLYEINEAFAVVTMAAMKDLALSHAKVNIHGGACALGHPLGSSGSRILITLLYALKQNQLKRGIAALCIGGGEATACAIEII